MTGKLGSLILLVVVVALFAVCASPQGKSGESTNRFAGWKTNTAKRSVNLDEILSGGPPKDGIPALDHPKFISIEDARKWLSEKEPVISLVIDGEARAYPLQILIWHEIINHEFKGVPVSVTFCPLCYSAIAFDRRIDGKAFNFGVTGMLRHSDMVMFDRETESWWQQITGEAIVGDLTGRKLRQIPAQIVGFGQFATTFPNGTVVSKETGHKRDYGRNPYVGYDNVTQRPYFPVAKDDPRLRPMEKIVVVETGKRSKAYPYSATRRMRVINDTVIDRDIVIFHRDGANSALDSIIINESKEVGATGVFVPEIDGKKLRFGFRNGTIIDDETSSEWNVFGHAVKGPLKGRRLTQLQHGDFFAFAWLTFRPDTEIYQGN
jgi:hypothetical protein